MRAYVFYPSLVKRSRDSVKPLPESDGHFSFIIATVNSCLAV